jgi:nucleotide-binding universal stress UspA family protein
MINGKQQIVVGVDGSVRADDALAFARRLAAEVGAGITLVSAFPHADWPAGTGNEQAEALLDRAARTIDTPVSLRAIEDGSPAHALQDVAEREGAALVVVGSTHRGRVGRVHPGSTADHLLHGAPCPVAVVPSGYRHHEAGIERIGVGDDGSAHAGAAVATAERLAAELSAALQVVRANGDAADTLVAESEQLDTLILGSRGRGPLPSVLLGSVSRAVVQRAACPVIVVPDDERARP